MISGIYNTKLCYIIIPDDIGLVAYYTKRIGTNRSLVSLKILNVGYRGLERSGVLLENMKGGLQKEEAWEETCAIIIA